MIKDLAARAIAAWLSWKWRKEYEASLARERRHLLHDMQEGA